jgi:hypothetical protein
MTSHLNSTLNQGHETKLPPQNLPENRRDEVARGWASYLKLEILTNAKHISQKDGNWKQDGIPEGATGDGANLFVLLKDETGIHAVKVGVGEFSPRTFQENFTWYGGDAMDYADRLKKLTAVTPVYVLEQEDGYFALSPTLNPEALKQFKDDPASYMAKHAHMIASAGKVDFNQDHRWCKAWGERDRTPSYVNEHGGGMVRLSGEQLMPIEVGDFEAALEQARKSELGAVVVAQA